MTAYHWRFIEDLPQDWQEMASQELGSLAPIWKERVAQLRESSSELKQFNERLGREWAIETGIIENLYSIDRGTTRLLIEHGLVADLIAHGTTDRPAEQIIPILRDHKEVLEGIFVFIKQGRDLSTSYIKDLHAALTRHQPTVEAITTEGQPIRVTLLRGEWKKQPNNPTRPDGEAHEYCPPEQVASEMDTLVSWHKRHIQQGVPPEVEAAWLHHRFTQIHPFQDGNGRVARVLASLIFLRAGWFPLIIHRDIRREYITALEQADSGDLKPLIQLFSDIQKKAFLKALSISEDVLKEHESYQQVIAAAIERLKARHDATVQNRKQVFALSTILEEQTKRVLAVLAQNLVTQLKPLDANYNARMDFSSPETAHWFQWQIIETAKQLEYYADTRTYAAWVRLRISEARRTELIVAFHALGVEFLGIMAASAFIEYRDQTEEGESKIDGPHALSDDVFQFAYNEQKQHVQSRFEEWLNKVTLLGLDHWRRQL
jgi:Fic family protein